MLLQRDFDRAQIFQVVELCGPTHARDFMFPDLAPPDVQRNAEWLFPRFWLPETDRLVFAIQLFVVKSRGETVIIDTGTGNFKPRLAPSQNQINTPALDWLKGIGCSPESVKHIVHTHMHGDHVGWDTYWADGRWLPTFPNATYYYPQGDWAVYQSRYAAGTEDHISTSFADSVKPVVDAGLARFVEDGTEIAGLLTAFAAPGHSPGHLGFALDAGDEECLFCGDVLHSPIQVHFPQVNSRWCEYPDIARSTRAGLLTRAAETGALLFPAHIGGSQGLRISSRNGRFDFAESSPGRLREARSQATASA